MSPLESKAIKNVSRDDGLILNQRPRVVAERPGINMSNSKDNVNRPPVDSRHVKTASARKAGRDDSNSRDIPTLSVSVHDKVIPIKYNSSISYDEASSALESRPFCQWIEKVSRVFGSRRIDLLGLEIQSIDFIDQRVDSIKLKVESVLKDDETEIKDGEMTEICWLRDFSVGILIELDCVEDDTIWSVLVDQPRMNIGAVSALELPVGHVDVDGDSVVGREITEVENSTGLTMKLSQLENLSKLAYENCSIYNASGLCPALGNCSEFVKIMYARKEITKREMASLRTRLSQMREEGASMTLRVVPLDDLWKVSADMKVVSALFLLERADIEQAKREENYTTEDDVGKPIKIGKRISSLLPTRPSISAMFGAN